MKTLGQQTSTTQIDFDRCIAPVGGSKVIIEQNPVGFDVNSMTGIPIVKVWEDPKLKSIQAEVNRNYLHLSSDMRFANLHNEIPEIDFVPISSSESLLNDKEIWR